MLAVLMSAGVLVIAGCGVALDSGSIAKAKPEVFEGPVPRAICGPGSIPEPADVFQGQIPTEEPGYRCNVEVVGEYEGKASWQIAAYEDCAYYNQDFPAYGFPSYKPAPEPGYVTDPQSYGTVVLSNSDPAKPTRTGTLVSAAMIDPHESLKLDAERALLAGVAGWDAGGNGAAFFDVYDVADDCTKPLMVASVPFNIPVGHEGEFAPGGTLYYGSALWTPNITALDVTDPSLPEIVSTIRTSTHGLSISDDGSRAYLAQPNLSNPGMNGLKILDVTAIHERAAAPVSAPVVLGEVYWEDGATAQMTIPVTIQGRPYIIFADEGGFGSVRIIDISDETNPVVVSKLKLEVHMPGINEVANVGVNNNAHYCGVPRRHEPEVTACTFRGGSGVRLFDIRDPYHPKELAYINYPDSYVGTTVHLIPERGEAWFADQRHGFFVIRFTNGVWPFKE